MAKAAIQKIKSVKVTKPGKYKAPANTVGPYTPTTYASDYKPGTYNDAYNPEQYNSRYGQQIEQGLNNITNWQYNPLQDANYQALAREYGRRGNQAAKNTLADAAALNGGMGTSYAVSAAQQARNDYNQQLAGLIPELEQNAYQRQQSALDALMGVDQMLYGRFSDDQSRQLQSKQFGLDVFNTNEGNRQFAANLKQGYDQMNQGENQFKYNADYDAFRDSTADAQWLYNMLTNQYQWSEEYNKALAGDKTAYDQWLAAQKKSGGGGGGGGGRSRSGGGGGGYTSAGTGNSGGVKIEEVKKKGSDNSTIQGSGQNATNTRSAKGLTTIKEKKKKSGGRVVL